MSTDPRGAIWSKADEDWLMLNYPRFLGSCCAKKLGRSEQAIRLKFHRMKSYGAVSKREPRNVSRATLEATA